MASGFIILNDGRAYARRFTSYDIIVESIIKELSSEGDELLLKEWLQSMIPIPNIEEQGGVEMGWGFIEPKGTCISRRIDVRCMQTRFRDLFLKKALIAQEQQHKKQALTPMMLANFEAFGKMIRLSVKGEPPEGFSDTSVMEKNEEEQGPGW